MINLICNFSQSLTQEISKITFKLRNLDKFTNYYKGYNILPTTVSSLIVMVLEKKKHLTQVHILINTTIINDKQLINNF